MNRINLTRREAEGIPPQGGIFLCPEDRPPAYIRLGIVSLEEVREQSEQAQGLLDKELRVGQERRAGTMLSTYGKELEAYVHDRSAKPEERSLDLEIVESVSKIEYLYDQSSAFQGIRDAIRLSANRTATKLVTQFQLGEYDRIGQHDYARVVGQFSLEFLCRLNEEDAPMTIFDWGGEVDGVTFMQALFDDQVTLLKDVMIHHGEQIDSQG